MAEISHEEEKLLLKLYNLKSDESTILNDIRTKKQNIGEMIEEAKSSKESTEREREELEATLSVFTSQKDAFFETFGGLKDADFDALRSVGVEVAVEPLLSSLSEKAPEYEDSLRKKIEAAKDRIVELFGQISTYGADLETAEEELARAEADRQSLASLVEQSLNGNESDQLSKQYIRGILANFDCFTEQELNALCKIILFPEEALVEFDRTYEERKNKPLEEVAPVVEEEPEEKEEPTLEPEPTAVEEEKKKEEATPVTIDIPEVVVPEATEVAEPTVVEEPTKEAESVEEIYGGEKEPKPTLEPEPTVEPEPTEAPVEDNTNPFDDAPTTIIDLGALNQALKEEESTIEGAVVESDLGATLEEIGLTREGFEKENAGKADEVYKFLKDVDIELIKTNYELLRSINADEEAYRLRDGHMFIADKELSEKINYLRTKSISEKKIKEIITTAGIDSVARLGFDVIKARVEALENTAGSVTDENISYIIFDTVVYAENIELAKKAFELDEKEERNFRLAFFSPYFAGDMKVLKEYLISIVKPDNGRYALNTFFNSPAELMSGVDQLIECGLGNLVSTNPELLGTNMPQLIKRANFLKTKGVEVYDEETESYIPELTDYTAFDYKYGDEVIPEVPGLDKYNGAIPGLVGNEDFTQILVETLNNYYSNPEINPEVKLDGELNETYQQLVASFEEMLKATKSGNLTYQVGDLSISRNKLERNIRVLLQALAKQGQQLEGVEKEVILTSLLYNLRAEEEKLRKVVETCLGFNKEQTVGGPEL